VYKGSIASPWDEVTIALIQVTTNVMDGNYSDAYREQAHLVKFVHPLLCVCGLRDLMKRLQPVLPILYQSDCMGTPSP